MKATFWTGYEQPPRLVGTLTLVDGVAVPDKLWTENHGERLPNVPRSIPFDGELIPPTEGEAYLRMMVEVQTGLGEIRLEEDDQGGVS